MRNGHFKGGAFAWVAFLVTFLAHAAFSARSTGADLDSELYQWSCDYEARTRGLVVGDSVQPHWFGKTKDRFWYRVTTGIDRHQYILVDASRGIRRPAMNHRQLAKQLAQQTGMSVRHDQLDLQGLVFDDESIDCRFRFHDRLWRFGLPAGPLEPLVPDDAQPERSSQASVAPQSRIRRSVGSRSDRVAILFDNRLSEPLDCLWVTSDGQLRSYGQVGAKSTKQISTFEGHAWAMRLGSGEVIAAFVASKRAQLAKIDRQTPRPAALSERTPENRNEREATSPDGRWRVRLDQGNVVVVDQTTGESKAVTDDATEADSYGGRSWWSPDSKFFVVMKTKVGSRRTINLIDSAPDDSIHSRLITVPYAKPGDEIDHSRPVLFDIHQFEARMIDDSWFDNPFRISDLRWRDDSASFSFVYNERGHQVLRLISVDAASADPRVVIDETSKTFICYSSKKYLHRLDETDEVIWMSERDGWNHLYLIDSQSGEVKNAITSGRWVVRKVDRVDPVARQLWLTVSGIDPGQDPYHQHLICVDFDGNHLTRLTEGDGDHQWDFSPHRRYLVDHYSRVDMPGVSELRSANTGRRICHLETADASRLMATGWSPPTRFVAKARDGQTDIHGIVIRPTHFDPQKKYPVLEAIYAGPHSAFVPKRFGRHASLYRMAELGFMVVKIDGMGTNHRSKSFHDVCWKNLADSGFPDRIAWIKAAAKQWPAMDLTRVGIWGGSAGGQSAMRALIAHGDFYKAAVADCGCHDNRVDKIWWNEQWMGWPVDAHYAEQSNVTQAHRLRGDLMLIWGELDRNVDPASTMQVIDGLVQADKDFELLIMPGIGHGAAGHPYARRRQADFLIRKLQNREPEQNTAKTNQ